MNESSLGYFPSQPIRLWWRSCVEGLREVGNDTRVCLIHILVLSTADQIQTDCQPETLLCLGPVEIYFLPLFLLVEGNCENTTTLLSDHHDLPFSYLHELLEFLISKPLWTPAVFFPIVFPWRALWFPIYIYLYLRVFGLFLWACFLSVFPQTHSHSKRLMKVSYAAIILFLEALVIDSFSHFQIAPWM